MERDEFLARVSRASLTSELPETRSRPSHIPALADTDLVTLFRSRAQNVNTVVHGPMSRHGVPRAVVGIAIGHDASNFLCWDDLPAPGVTSALQAAGLDRVDHDVPGDGRTDHNLTYSQVELGVTGADVALAESGSIVLIHGVGRPRMASLVPEVHIALLDVDVLERNLAQWAATNPELPRETANLVIVTGPSRTGDIEQRLNLGVHGPRHVHIVMIR